MSDGNPQRVLEKPGHGSILSHVPLIAFLVCSAGLMLCIAWQPTHMALRYVSDDGFYYMATANNVALGNGSTFDGVNPTNGYHPLWMWTLIPVYLLLPHSIGLAMSVSITLQIGLYAVAVVLLCRLLRYFFPMYAVILGLMVLVSPWVFRVWINGLEGSLHLLMLVLAAGYFAKNRDKILQGRNWSKEAVLGVLLGLLILARIDSASLAVSIAVVIVVANRDKLRKLQGAVAVLKKIVRIAVASFVIVVPYFAWNILKFGHLMTISGTVKSQGKPFFWSNILNAVEKIKRNVPVLKSNALFVPVVLGLVLLALFLLKSRSQMLQKTREKLWKFDFMFVFAVIHMLAIFTFMRNFTIWYVVPEIILGVLVASAIAATVLERCNSRLRAAVITAAVVVMASAFFWMSWNTWYLHRRGDDSFNAVVYRAAEWLSKEAEPSAIIGCWDAGVMGYFCQRRVVNLDGVVNNFEYLPYLKKGDITEYLRQQRISVIAQSFHDQTIQSDGSIDDANYRAAAGCLGEMIKEFKLTGHTGRCYHFCIWRCSP